MLTTYAKLAWIAALAAATSLTTALPNISFPTTTARSTCALIRKPTEPSA